MSLPITTIGVAALDAASLALAFIPGQARLSALFATLARGLQSGLNIDAHMAEVTKKLQAGPVVDADWADVISRIEADSARLQRT